MLPARRTRLIGRTGELEAVRDRILHGDRRLVALTGAGGIGKTTLALEVARRLEPAMPDGAWFVDLTVVREPDGIALATCSALGILDRDRPPLETLVDHLSARQALVVLDNCEHLGGAVAWVVDMLLDSCPDLRLLATSRAALGLRDESTYVLAPFNVPGPGAADDLAALAHLDAVQLFVERATAVDPSFTLSPTTAAAVASICARLDGIPLAIELAAAHASVLSVTEIDERLSASGDLAALPERARSDGSARQQTMEATLDWSHDLLVPGEQALFRRLAVFVGGWTLEAAERVASPGRDHASIVPDLARLVTHSLVIRTTDGARSRYRMLAPIAEYAARKLAASDDAGPVSIAHATYFLEVTTSRYASVGEGLPEDLDRTAAEHENCLAAIAFARSSGILPLRLGLIRNLIMFWRVHGHLHLAVQQLAAILDDVADGSYERALVLSVLAEFRHVMGDYDASESEARQAETIFSAIGEPMGRRAAIGVQGLAAAGRGDYKRAIAEFERARPLVEAGPGDIISGYWHAGMGRFLLALGDLEAAEQHLELARAHFQREPSWFVGRVLAMLGTISRRTGEHLRAERQFAEALDSLRRYGATVEAISCLEGRARLAIDQGDSARATTLLAAATGLRDATATALPNEDREPRRAAIDRVRTDLGPGAYATAWNLGLGMTLDQAADFAVATEVGPPTAASVPSGSALTNREREIAALVALGLTNRQIAERLVIAPGTVKVHVERILGKLGRTSRVQIATWALEEGDLKDMPSGRRAG